MNFASARGVAWPSGLRRWFKAPVSSEAWVRIPPLPGIFWVFGVPFSGEQKRSGDTRI